MKIGYETAVACIPAYFQDELAIAYAKMLRTASFDKSLIKYINPPHSLNRQVASILNEYPSIANISCLAVLLNMPEQGLVIGVKIFEMFYCFILSKKEDYIDQRILLLVNDSINRKFFSFFIKKPLSFNLVLEGEEFDDRHHRELQNNKDDISKIFTSENKLLTIHDAEGKTVLQNIEQLPSFSFTDLNFKSIATINQLEFGLENAYLISVKRSLRYKLLSVKFNF